MTKIISKQVDHTVTLGQAGYGDTLTVTRTGYILPATPGANGVYVPAGTQGARITNHGTILGAASLPGITRRGSASTWRHPAL